ncbi:hypothetical protein ACL02T_31725 [Pseudonocardia sp. RS010]|uniref:hypothetical protein n=1 Tax=Pseudonocardia sp. RS010 TaxID=3385979 RepID=UPI00399FF9B3
MNGVLEKVGAPARGAGRLAQRKPRAVRIGLLVAIAVFAAAAATLFVLHVRHSTAAAEEADAHGAADRAVSELLTYDHTTVAKDVDRYAGLVTGPFGDDYVNLLRNVVVPAAERDQVSTRTEVVSSSVIGREGDTVNVLMFVNQASQAGNSPAGAPSGSRVRVAMENVEGTWKISGFTPL